ncbi:glycosyl hydrolase family 18 protein [Sporolactobacillus shoreicorticis]|uniref:Glycosyl hydrolase family 18 protein n=1 Tax=Sporolactobacillus shoreicorticis TaxID=1923877 RepID=A0ABW5S1Q9_9BACL|nr:glycosyl hydrolase family 18 protein [Sporolactobacillus shoreicorticis]MCO7126430.1 glycosyl hydrolase family 18 protein [Sporolactobacillus shoreicorticis]
MDIHVVQSGESLWGITQHYQVPLVSIVALNGLAYPERLVPGQALVIPSMPPVFAPERPVIEVNAYTYQPVKEAAAEIVQRNGLLSTVLPFAYHVTEDGNLDDLDDQESIAAAYANSVMPLMPIVNFALNESGADVAHAIFTTPVARENLVSSVIRVMQQKGYRGLNIDFESVRPEDRQGFNDFLQFVVDRLHPFGFSVSTAVMPKTAIDQPRADYIAYDYEAHGQIVDFVVLMTYEWGYRLGPPQAISPVNEMKRVIEYALSVMPASKISLGFETYARDWLLPHKEGQEAETFSPKEALERAIFNGVSIQFDETAQSPFYTYVDASGSTHEVWFEDARSAQAKFDLVRQYNLRGISYWALGFPYPENWALLERNFSVGKWL